MHSLYEVFRAGEHCVATSEPPLYAISLKAWEERHHYYFSPLAHLPILHNGTSPTA